MIVLLFLTVFLFVFSLDCQRYLQKLSFRMTFWGRKKLKKDRISCRNLLVIARTVSDCDSTMPIHHLIYETKQLSNNTQKNNSTACIQSNENSSIQISYKRVSNNFFCTVFQSIYFRCFCPYCISDLRASTHYHIGGKKHSTNKKLG